MPRTRRSAEMIAARQAKRRRSSANIDQSWMKWRVCELCGRSYCVNNNERRKVRLVKWKGFIICASCRYGTVRVITKLMDDKVLRFTKRHLEKLESG